MVSPANAPRNSSVARRLVATYKTETVDQATSPALLLALTHRFRRQRAAAIRHRSQRLLALRLACYRHSAWNAA